MKMNLKFLKILLIVFNQWNNSLSNNERDNLKQLIETVRINVKSNQKDYSIPRKIVSIKRNDK